MKTLILMILFISSQALAFPEMIRHHYVSCTACHFAPSGGGLLTQYGRTISAELLSTWGGEKEARSFYGGIDSEKINSWLQVGGSVRALQFHHESGKVTEGRTIPMQAGVELAVLLKKWTGNIFVGKLDKDWRIDPVGTRFYLMYQFLDELTVRIGRFIPVFGLNIPQHTVVTRSGLGFNQGQERDSLEAMWSGETWNFAWTASQSVPVASEVPQETAVSTQVNYILNDSHKLGMSFWLGNSDQQNRSMVGLHGTFGFTKKFYLLAEIDVQNRYNTQNQSVQKGLFQFTKWGFEATKGLHLQFVQEYSQSNLDKDATQFESYGPGVLFYPRPHFEFEALYTKKKISAIGKEFEDYAYLLGHFYF